jgi:hypothetical protein
LAALEEFSRGHRNVSIRTDFPVQSGYMPSKKHGLEMAEYRVFTIGRDGHFISFRKFSSMDDADAVVWAKQLIDLYPVELWCGDRLVTRLDPEVGEAAGPAVIRRSRETQKDHAP